MEPSNETTGLVSNSIYQDFDEKAITKTVLKSEKSTVKSTNKKGNETFPQNFSKKIIFKPDETTEKPMSKPLNVLLSQKIFKKKENAKTTQTNELSFVKSPSNSIYEFLLALYYLNKINKGLLKIFQENPGKNYFFGKEEKTFGIVISYDINKISKEYYKYEFHNKTTFICMPHDHFIISINKIIELIKNAFIYSNLKSYSESEQLFLGDIFSSEQINEVNYKSINEEDVIFLYIINGFVYNLNFNFYNSLINNFTKRNTIKIDINVYFYKNIKYTSTFGNAFEKIINEYSIIHQKIKDVLIKGYYFILFQEKLELYKIIHLLKNREIRILYSILFGHNLIDEFLDKKNAERIEQIEQSDYLEFCNNIIDDVQFD